MIVLAPLQLLVVCTANQCRSPLAEAIARRQIAARHGNGVVCSAGTRAVVGAPAVEDTVAAARERSLDLSGHRSRPLDAELVGWANLLVTMERAHALDAVTVHGATLARTFTLPDIAARAASRPRRPDQQIDDWLAEIGADRTAPSLLGGAGDGADEVPDPIGRPLKVHRATAASLDAMLSAVMDAIYGPADPRG